MVCTWRSDLLKVAKQGSHHALMWLSKELVCLKKTGAIVTPGMLIAILKAEMIKPHTR